MYLKLPCFLYQNLIQFSEKNYEMQAQTFLSKSLTSVIYTLREKCPYSELFWSVFSRIVSLRIHSECGKIRTRITSNTDTFYEETIEIFCNLILRNYWTGL